MSGTGKSTLVGALRERGYRAVDADEPGWSEYRAPEWTVAAPRERELVWRDDRIDALLSEDGSGAVFLAGCASNQVRFYPRFNVIVLLSAPAGVLIERLAKRTTNDYGKRPGELDLVLEDQRIVEPLLRRAATLELDATLSVDTLVGELVALAADSPRTRGA